MKPLEKFLENCQRIREQVLADADLQERIREIQTHRKWDHKATTGNANYATLKPFELGLKQRQKDDLSYWKVEPPVTAYLWQKDVPISSFLVVVNETQESLTYLVEDFGTMVNDPYKLLSEEERATRRATSQQSRDLIDRIRKERERIQQHGRNRRIELTGNAMGYPKNNPRWCVAVFDLDPGASFTGEFDALEGGWQDTFGGEDTEYKFLLNIYTRLLDLSLKIIEDS